MDLIKRVRIDKAINALDGNASNAAEGYNNNYNFLMLDELRGYRFVAGGQYYLGESICTRAEFEARKAERQNKPSWDEHDYKFIHQGKNGHWYGSLKDNPASLPDIITDECWHYIEAASARRGEVFGDYRNTLELRPNHIGESSEKGGVDAAIEAMRDIRTAFANQAVSQFNTSARYVDKHPCGLSKVEVTVESGASIDFEWLANQFDDVDDINAVWALRDKLHHKNKPATSPELSFHLSNAFNELQAGARLLPDSDPRRGQLVALAVGIGAVKEVE